MACKTCKLKRIIKGWSSLIWENPAAEAIAMKRAHICAACKFNRMGICSKCGCPIKPKIRVLEETCKIGLWPE